MDERPPRQPGSPGSPDEQSDGTRARQPRPENPYRIPQRPAGARPKDTGGFGFTDPRPTDPSVPSEAPAGAGDDDPPTEPWELPRESWEPPRRPWESNRESAPAPEAPGRQEQDWTIGAGGEPWSPSGEPEKPRGSRHRAPEPVQDDSDVPMPEPVTKNDDKGWETFDGDVRQEWGRPTEPEPTRHDWERPSQESWDVPVTGTQENWSTPGTTPGEDQSTPSTGAQESWSAPATGEQESWNTPGAGGQESWNSPATGAQENWSTPGTTPGEDWNTPSTGAQESWSAPATGTQENWGVPASTPREDQSTPSTGAQESWNTPGAGAGEDWNTPSTGAQESRHAPEPGQGRPAQDPAASAESWQTPYRGQPTYGGDTPYPGSVPVPPEEGPTEPPNDRHHSDGYEFLYSGPGSQGPGGPQDPGGPGGPYDDDAYDPGPPPRKKRRGLLIGVIAAVVILAMVGGAAGWYVYTLPEPEEATSEYEAAWEAQDYSRLAAVTTGDDAEAILGGIDTGLGVNAVDVRVDTPVTDGGTGSASYEVTVSMTNADDWGWEGELPLLREDGQWWVDFSPEVAYPGLGEGQVLARTAVWGERGQIQASDGTRLDTPDISGSLQMIVGELGEADEDDVERLGPAYSVGDTIGKTGLQRTHEERLAGEAATTIVMVDAAEAEDPASLEATEDNTVVALDGSDGESITTSIDMSVQNAASSAIIEADDPAGMVAIRPSTGEILAAVNVPGGFNRAFEGQYPPGSSFKIVTYSALLDNGLSVDATMECPEEYELGGWPFRNAGNAEYGEQSVTEAFATSCNTALVDEIDKHLSPETLLASAEQFGMNAPLDIGVSTHEPSFPPVDSSTMMGAQGIGQGQILTSPLHMATVPAAVADGSWRHPVLVTEPAREDLPEPTVIGNAEALRPMMRAVVTEGTAKDVDFEGEVFGKTGTAEYGTAEDADEDDELPSHAWMVGYKGDVAFAVVVDGGGGGSAVAGPLAAAFTNAL